MYCLRHFVIKYEVLKSLGDLAGIYCSLTSGMEECSPIDGRTLNYIKGADQVLSTLMDIQPSHWGFQVILLQQFLGDSRPSNMECLMDPKKWISRVSPFIHLGLSNK